MSGEYLLAGGWRPSASANIKDLNAGTSIADMTWTDLSVTNGSFDGGTIEGSFYAA